MRLTVWVRPGAPRTSVGGRRGDGDPPALVVHVQPPALDGRANAAVIDALAEALGVQRSALRIAGGARSRTKIVEIDAPPTSATAIAHTVAKLLDD